MRIGIVINFHSIFNFVSVYRVLRSRSRVILNFIIFSAKALLKNMTWLSFMEFRFLLATKLQFLLNLWFKNASLAVAIYSKIACFWISIQFFSAGEQCFPKTRRIQAWNQPIYRETVNYFKWLNNI